MCSKNPISGESFDQAAIESIADAVAAHTPWTRIRDVFLALGYGNTHQSDRPREYVSQTLREMQETEGQRSGVLTFLLDICNPQAWVTKPTSYAPLLDKVNKVLGFYALSIGHDGCLRPLEVPIIALNAPKSSDESEFDTRNFHALVVRHGKEPFCKGLHAVAVFECCKAFDNAVQVNTGIQESGKSLMGRAFSPTGPLKINPGSTQNEKDEQEGIQFLSMGLMMGIRNPQGHSPIQDYPIGREEALEMLALVSFLFRKLELAKVQTSSGNISVTL